MHDTEYEPAGGSLDTEQAQRADASMQHWAATAVSQLKRKLHVI